LLIYSRRLNPKTNTDNFFTELEPTGLHYSHQLSFLSDFVRSPYAFLQNRTVFMFRPGHRGLHSIRFIASNQSVLIPSQHLRHLYLNSSGLQSWLAARPLSTAAVVSRMRAGDKRRKQCLTATQACLTRCQYALLLLMVTFM